MSNVHDVKAKSTPLVLTDGKERHIKFTLNALAELEERYGTVDAAFKALEDNSMKAVRCVLWAGLSWEDATLTEKQVGDLIDIEYMQTLMQSLNGALTSDMPADMIKNPEEAKQAQIVSFPTRDDWPEEPPIEGGPSPNA